MTETCPNCGGHGYVAPHNGVDPKNTEEVPCMVCQTTGKVESEPTRKLIIRKYYGAMAE